MRNSFEIELKLNNMRSELDKLAVRVEALMRSNGNNEFLREIQDTEMFIFKEDLDAVKDDLKTRKGDNQKPSKDLLSLVHLSEEVELTMNNIREILQKHFRFSKAPVGYGALRQSPNSRLMSEKAPLTSPPVVSFCS
jgi:hypothetical protein